MTNILEVDEWDGHHPLDTTGQHKYRERVIFVVSDCPGVLFKKVKKK